MNSAIAQSSPNAIETTLGGSTEYKPFQFFELPYEIRHIIYEATYINKFRRVSSGVFASSAYNVGLLMTCKQVHEEAVALFYHETPFVFDLNPDYGFDLSTLLSPLPKQTLDRIQTAMFRVEFPAAMPVDLQFSALRQLSALKEVHFAIVITDIQGDAVAKSLTVNSPIVRGVASVCVSATPRNAHLTWQHGDPNVELPKDFVPGNVLDMAAAKIKSLQGSDYD